MPHLSVLYRGVAAAVGGFFGLVFLWAAIESIVGTIVPGPARGAGFLVLAVAAAAIGVAAACLKVRQDRAGGRKVGEKLIAALVAIETARKSATQAAEPADAGPGIDETVTVVLRRQIPPRFGETPRSWIGGLPMLSDGVAWPRSVSSEYRDRGERPLHFVAQICCADLPAALWGGFGPRQGWLLLFLDPNQGVPEGPDAFRILHTAALGAERAPPADLGPVHDGVYTGWDYQYCGEAACVPRVWRRWPVDLVAIPNEARLEGRQVVVGLPDLAQRLYDGAIVAAAGDRPPEVAPFTRRGVVYAMNAALYKFGKARAQRPLPDSLVARLREPGCLEDMRARLEGRRGIAQADGWLAFLSRNATPEALLAYFEDAQARLETWHAEGRARLVRLRDAWDAGDPDEAVSPADWAALQAEAAGEPYQAVGVRAWNDQGAKAGEAQKRIGLFDDERRVVLEPGRGVAELIADYYVDPVRRALIPPAVVATFEVFWRRLVEDRPHRMGGYHDGVQSSATIGPSRQLLLFQIASDNAMHWCWGDVGAYYVYASPADLRAGHFAAATMILECH